MKRFKESNTYTAFLQFTNVLVLIASVLCMAPQWTAIAQAPVPNPPVNIPDTTLRNLIVNELNIPRDASGRPRAITQADMLRLTSLNVENQSIGSLQGLEAASNLTFLQLYRANISDISMLANLTNLKHLLLTYNAISDISAVSNLTNLVHLDLGGNQISNISPLAKLGFTTETRLQQLSLGDNQISDISPLADLIYLRNLNIEKNAISDISILANLQRVGTLLLSDNQISDISPLANLRSLTHLHLDKNQISDFSPIDALIGNLKFYSNHSQRVVKLAVNIPDPALRETVEQALAKATTPPGLPTPIWEAGSPISQEDMASLTILRAGGVGIVDLTGLESAINLRQLELHDNAIVDLSPLANLTQLGALSLQRNRIVDVSPLANLVNLQILLLQKNQIVDFSPLDSLNPAWYVKTPQLIAVNIPDAGLRGALEQALGKATGVPIWQTDMESLTTLRAGDAGIVNLTGLEAALNLIHLELHNNAIVDLLPLANLTQLTRLSLQRNRIEDVSPLTNLTNLTLLFLQNNHIADFSPLDGLNPAWFVKDQQDVAPIEIPDVALRDALEQALGKTAGAPITQNDMESLTILRAGDAGIIILTGLDTATNLTQLELHNNAIVDLSPLANLTQLTALSLHRNQIEDVSPLANLTNLKWLFLQHNRIADFSPLDGLNPAWFVKDPQRIVSPPVVIPDTRLRGALEQALGKVGGDTITQTDIESLEVLSAVGVRIVDLTGLEAATNLRHLDLQNNAIVDLSPLADLTNLTVLNVQSNQIVDVSPLANLTNLIELSLAHNRITDFSPLDDLVGQLDLYSHNPQDTDTDAGTQTAGQEGDAPAESEGDPSEDTEEAETLFPEGIDIKNPRPSGGDIPVPGEVTPRCDSPEHKEGDPCLEPPPEENFNAPQLGIDINGDGIIDVRDRMTAKPEPLPERTALLANYPNPFNPETWLPYQLAAAADVSVSLYNVEGRLIRTLDLGHQAAGVYRSKSRAAYWDGRNALGERVASGLYFYVLTAGDFTATRKMLILK